MLTIIGIWDKFVGFVMWVSCSVLDLINVALNWILKMNREVIND